MIKKLDNFNDLLDSYYMLLKNYNYDESEIIRYIESCIRNSVPIDFYSLFLKKAQLEFNSAKVDSYKKTQLEVLENYIINKFK